MVFNVNDAPEVAGQRICDLVKSYEEHDFCKGARLLAQDAGGYSILAMDEQLIVSIEATANGSIVDVGKLPDEHVNDLRIILERKLRIDYQGFEPDYCRKCSKID